MIAASTVRDRRLRKAAKATGQVRIRRSLAEDRYRPGVMTLARVLRTNSTGAAKLGLVILTAHWQSQHISEAARERSRAELVRRFDAAAEIWISDALAAIQAPDAECPWPSVRDIQSRLRRYVQEFVLEAETYTHDALVIALCAAIDAADPAIGAEERGAILDALVVPEELRRIMRWKWAMAQPSGEWLQVLLFEQREGKPVYAAADLDVDAGMGRKFDPRDRPFTVFVPRWDVEVVDCYLELLERAPEVVEEVDDVLNDPIHGADYVEDDLEAWDLEAFAEVPKDLGRALRSELVDIAPLPPLPLNGHCYRTVDEVELADLIFTSLSTSRSPWPDRDYLHRRLVASVLCALQADGSTKSSVENTLMVAPGCSDQSRAALQLMSLYLGGPTIDLLKKSFRG